MAILDKSKLWELTKIGPKDRPKTISLPRVTLASVESLTIPLVQEVVLLADFRCKGCQERVADIMSRMNGESESVVVSLLEKKVTVTCRYPRVVKFPTRKLDENYVCCMVMRVIIDCDACCRKMGRILLNMKEIETHLIEKQQLRVSACGRFKPSDVAIKIRKKMNRRVEILEIQEFYTK